MNVVAWVHLFPPQHNAGAEYMLSTILRFLIARGHDCTVYASRNRTRYEWAGITVEHGLGRHVTEAVKAADIAITHLDLTPMAMKASRASGTPLVHLIHNDRQLTHNRVTGDAAALVVPNSEWIEDAIAWPGRTLIVRPPVMLTDYETDSTGEFVTLLNLGPAKGSGLFYDLADRLPEREFLAVAGAYAAQTIPKHRPANVTMQANTPKVVEKVYARTRVLLMPSSYESWGRCAIEAACSGIPTIAHPTPGLLEALGPAGIFCDRDDPHEWIAELERLDDPDEYAAAGKAARARAEALDLVARDDLFAFEAALLDIAAED